MKIKYLFFIFSLIVSCSSHKKTFNDGFRDKNVFVINDSSGEYFLERDVIVKKSKLISRQKIYSSMDPDKLLEKSITVSSLGKLKTKNSMINYTRPDVSQFTIWFEKQKFFSQLKTNKKNKSLEVIMLSPEDKWNGSKEIQFPKASTFCFYTQIPECIRYQGHLDALINKKAKLAYIYIIWDSYPYQGEQLNNISETPFQKATLSYEGKQKGLYRFIVDLGNQSLLYQFDLDLKFEMMFWIAQGITIKKQNFEE